jgi:hypothetical protein
MKSFLALAATLAGLAAAATPPAARLLPTNTLALVTAPDLAAAGAAWRAQPWGRLWADPALAAFRGHAQTRFRTNVVEPLTRALGLDLAALAAAATGQFTFAAVAGAEGPQPLLIAETGTNAARVEALLADARGRWAAAGRAVTTNEIEGGPALTVAVPQAELAAVWRALAGTSAPAEEGKEDGELLLTLAGRGGVLVAGGATNAVAGVLARLGAGGPALADLAAHQADAAAVLGDAPWQGWVNAPLALDTLLPAAPEAGQRRRATPSPARVVAALGLRDVRSLAFALRGDAAGAGAHLFIHLPPDARRGLFRLLAIEAKDAAPPPFVPADAVEFSRSRFNGARAWEALEQTLAEVSPEMAGVFQLFFSALVDDAEPDFDFRRSFVGNLGDDYVSWKAPAAGTNAEPAGLTLLGSPNAPRLARALRLAARLLPPGEDDAPDVTTRELAGARVYSVGLPGLLAPGGAAGRLEFAAAGTNYVALGGDPAALDAFLTNAPVAAPLAGVPGFAAALAQAGGAGGGLVAYEDTRAALRRFFAEVRAGGPGEALPAALQPLAAARMAGRNAPDPAQWFDFTLLPPFEAVERHLGMRVTAGAIATNGWHLRFRQTAGGE